VEGGDMQAAAVALLQKLIQPQRSNVCSVLLLSLSQGIVGLWQAQDHPCTGDACKHCLTSQLQTPSIHSPAFFKHRSVRSTA
jgi:hypothetical protein